MFFGDLPTQQSIRLLYKVLRVYHPKTSNQSMELTTTRHVFTFILVSTFPLRLRLGFRGRSSFLSR